MAALLRSISGNNAVPAADVPRGEVLVIKLGALGDFFMALPVMQALRAAHCNEAVSLLTIPALAPLARTSGLFDRVLEDPLGRWPWAHWRQSRAILRGGYRRVYDLQGNRRTGWYFRLMLSRQQPEWAGPVSGCALPRPPRPPGAHRTAWYAAQLAALGIEIPRVSDPTWLAAPIEEFGVPDRFALVVPGGSAHRPAKRWPVAQYRILCAALLARGVTPVLLGTAVDAEACRAIASAEPACIDLTGRTSLGAIASLARLAIAAIGNDTGPMHVIASTGCTAVTLYSAESDPAFIAPLGPRVHCLQRANLATLEASDVLATLEHACPA